MKLNRRNALQLFGVGVAQTAMMGKAWAAPPTSYIDRYCYCSDILVNASPQAAMTIMATGENHTLWASSIKREVSPGLWVGTSIFTGKESIHLRFKIDAARGYVDYMVGSGNESVGEMSIANWGRILPGKMLGYSDKTSLIALYQPRRANQDINAFLQGRDSHGAEMYRIKELAEKEAPTPANTLLSGQYLASYSEQVAVTADQLMDFISDGVRYGLYTWGRKARTKVSENVYRCPSDFGGPDVFVRIEADRVNKTVDYYLGRTPATTRLVQSARVFDGRAFGFDAKTSLVTFTRWRAAGMSDFEWDRAMANQLQETNMTKAVLQR